MKVAAKKTIESMRGILEQMHADLETTLDTVQTEYDAKSEKWQESEKGNAEAARIQWLETARRFIYEAIDGLNEAIGSDDE